MQISGSTTLPYARPIRGDADRNIGIADGMLPRGDEIPASPAALARTAREKIDADHVRALEQGTRIVADTANGGRHLDLSSLSDDELAAVATGDGFTGDESLTAKAELAGRMGATLAQFEGDPRATALAVRSLYPALSPAVRDALGWNEPMLQSGDAVIRNFGGKPTGAEQDSVIGRLMTGLNGPGGLQADRYMLGGRSTISLTA